MPFVDTHCHLDFEKYDEDRDEVVERCGEELAAVVNSGTDADGNRATLDLSEAHGFVHATLGLHPTYIEEVDDAAVEEIAAQVRENADRILGIGEIGLDYHHVREDALRERQEEVFRRMLELAEDLGLPAVLHTRDAEPRALEIVEQYEVDAVQHCFNGRPELAREAVDAGQYISVSTQVLYSTRVQEIAAEVPLDRILLETDAPFLYQGERNVPWHVKESAEEIADIKDVSAEEVGARTTENAVDALGLPL